MTTINLEHLNQWLNKEEVVETEISVEQANLMNVTLSRDATLQAGDALPHAWHWLYFHDTVRGDELGHDGHAKLGGFLPPVPLPRRMWAGGKIDFVAPILLGETAIKRSSVKSITPKQGRSGQLCFVSVEHEITVTGERRLLETQTLVYREASPPDRQTQVKAQAVPIDADFSATYQPDAAMLFRYSALTFNSHRIHYDIDFCRNDEGYPGLVVHGPLTATLLLDLFHHKNAECTITSFDYRGVSPLFNPNSFSVHGKSNGDVWALNHEAGLAMQGKISTANQN
ncbi:MAG: MaoC family dehydratase N-terminal domain-containing protein [Chloroflexota bacterium]